MADILDGKKVAEALCSQVLLEISLLPVVPKIVFVMVGDDGASQTYVRAKTKRCTDLGLRSETKHLPGDTSEDALIKLLQELNKDKDVHGVLVQLPLPKGMNRRKVLNQIDPLKDVDGLTTDNMGRLFLAEPRYVPCTPFGVMELLKHYNIPIAGRRAVVIGRSEIVGKPMAQLLSQSDATVTVCHSKTVNLAEETSRADILVVAMGQPKAIRAEHVKDGAVVIDVGIHRTEAGLVGDVDFDSVKEKAGYLTPVPGGVGPLTIASLMKNLVSATKFQQASTKVSH